jgi:hypothetical protein
MCGHGAVSQTAPTEIMPQSAVPVPMPAPVPADSHLPGGGPGRRRTAPIPVAAVDGTASTGAAGAWRGAGQPLPGAPMIIPITPRPRLIMLGALFIIIGMWALLSFLPGNKPQPMEPGTPPPVGQLSDGSYYAGNVIAFALLLIGGTVVVTAALHRAQTEVLCRTCHAQVIGWKDSFGLLCPLDRHYARIDWVVLIATIGFWAITAILFLVLAVIVIF